MNINKQPKLINIKYIVITIVVLIIAVISCIDIIYLNNKIPSKIYNTKVENLGNGFYSVNFGNYKVEVQKNGSGIAKVIGIDNPELIAMSLEELNNSKENIYISGKGNVSFNDLVYIAEELKYTNCSKKYIKETTSCYYYQVKSRYINRNVDINKVDFLSSNESHKGDINLW